MGDIADQLIEQELGRRMAGDARAKGSRRNNPQRGVGKGRWMSSAGAVDMVDMSDEHMINAIMMCRKHGNTGKERELLAEAKRRGVAFRVT